MKLSDAKPCAICNGPLLKPMAATWYVVRVTQAMLSPRAANQVLGMAQFFQGSLALAEVFAPAEDAILIMGDKEPALMTELHICMDCMHGKLLELPIAMERKNSVPENEAV